MIIEKEKKFGSFTIGCAESRWELRNIQVMAGYRFSPLAGAWDHILDTSLALAITLEIVRVDLYCLIYEGAGHVAYFFFFSFYGSYVQLKLNSCQMNSNEKIIKEVKIMT